MDYFKHIYNVAIKQQHNFNRYTVRAELFINIYQTHATTLVVESISNFQIIMCCILSPLAFGRLDKNRLPILCNKLLKKYTLHS